MSYTPPSGDALVFDFSTAGNYTPPAGGALVFDFNSGLFVEGFKPATFGIPTTTLRADGISAGAFGTPAGREVRCPSGFSLGVTFGDALAVGYFQAQPFQATKFGIASLPLPTAGLSNPAAFGGASGRLVQVHASSAPSTVFADPLAWFSYTTIGAIHTSFGVPAGPHNVFASGASETTFGVPAGPHNTFATGSVHTASFGIGSIPLVAEGVQSCTFGTIQAKYSQYTQASGMLVTKETGGHFAYVTTTQQQGVVAQPFGWVASVMGDGHAAQWDQFSQASGEAGQTQFGWPEASLIGVAAGVEVSQFGTHAASVTGHASGAIAAHFGQHAGGYSLSASGMIITKFGNSACLRIPTYGARGLNLGRRLGVPALIVPASYVSRGLNIGRRFGHPRGFNP